MLLRMASRAALPRRVVMVSEVELVQSFVFCRDDAVGVYHNVVIAEVLEGVDGEREIDAVVDEILKKITPLLRSDVSAL
jgi:hypothetical protein